MKRPTLKLISLLCITLLLAFAAILEVFNYTMTNHLATNAGKAINYVVQDLEDPRLIYDDSGFYNIEEDDSLSAVASCLLVDKNYSAGSYELTKRRELAQYCGQHPSVGGEIEYVSVSGRQYYVTQIYDVTGLETDGGIWIVYVDVTSEQALIHRIDVSMLVIMALCAALACYAGIRIGVSIESGEERQKKFFENASHELKTPLMSIQGYAEGIYSGVIPDQKHAVSVILSESDKMAALVDEILCLSRIESGETRLQLENVPVDEAVNNCLVSLESVIQKKNLQIETHLFDVSVRADASSFETAVMNLLSNAVKYAGSKIVVSCDEHSLSVWNDGGELSENDTKNIFDRFYIGKNGSTGIGLALTKEIVSRHGWKIGVENRSGGPLFTIRFSKSSVQNAGQS